jgi:thiamine kinase-like enzyme
LIQYKLGLHQNVDILELPFYGNLSLRVHRGYKIFDFNRKKVVKKITDQIDSDLISNEIEAVRQASRLGFSPGILNWNDQERWYEEEFIHGCPLYSDPREKTDVSIEIYHHNIRPCLAEMIFLEPIQTIEIQEYINRLIASVARRKSIVSNENSQETRSIFRFIELMAAKVNCSATGHIPLVFSHGDFSLVNILKTDGGLKVIDWEGTDRRNPLYDFYNYFLTESYYKRTTKCLVSEIRQGIRSLQSSIASRAPKIASTLKSFSDIYRWIYYIERICMLLERDFNQRILDVISRSIDVFNQYEEKSAKL